MIIKKSREYYQRKASINKKANQSTAYKIQVYNNNRVDELVKRYNEGEAYTGTPESVLYAELAILNKPEVYRNYNHIIRSKFTSNDNIDNLNVKNKANRELDRIVSAEVERVSKNLQYVEQVLQKYTIPQKQYEEFKAKQEQSSIANRQQILKEVAVKANDLLVSDGLNIPNGYTYRNIETTAENLLRQSQMGSKHEEILAINSNYKNQGKDEIYTGKEWIWTGRGETTRHRSNHLQKRQLKEPFVIVNDKTLHIDELMYPCDPAGSFSNAFICYCEVQYLTGDARDYQNLGSLSLNQTKYKVKNPILTPKEHKKPTLKNPVPLKLTGHHIEYTETLKNGSELKIYEFENGFTIGIEEGSPVTHEQVINHILSLPAELINQIKLKRINLYLDETTKGGYSDILKNIMLQYSSNESVSTILDNLTHELSHAFDYQQVEQINHAGLSLREVYDKIFIADNKLGMKYTNPETGEVFYRERFPTEYAKTSYHAFKKMHQEDMEAWNNRTRDVPKPYDKRYSEDFAESSKLYLNPATHDKFVKEFPNRARYLEGLYGKPKFNVAPTFATAEQLSKQFNKDNSVKISQQNLQVIEPTKEQLQSALTKKELEIVQWAKDVQTSEFISATGKAKARQQLEELYAKALNKTPKPEKVPKQEVKVEPLKPKIRIVEEQPVKPNPVSVEDKVSRMSSQELYDSMTKADKKKYDKAKQKLETVEKNLATIGENDLLLGMKKDRLLEIRQLEQKQRDKLANKGKRKPKEKVVRTHERTLDNIYDDVDLPLKKLVPALEKWIDKRCKNTSEFGYHFNISTGEIIDGLKDGEIRGVKGRITMADLGAETGSIHSHPRNGMSAPSIEDLETFRCKSQDHHFMVSEHEIWYVHATDRFGIGAMGQQLDLQKAHKDCRDRAFERVSKEIKKGKLEATEEAIAEKLDEYTGDEILKTFNKPPWNKTMTVKRYYR